MPRSLLAPKMPCIPSTWPQQIGYALVDKFRRNRNHVDNPRLEAPVHERPAMLSL